MSIKTVTGYRTECDDEGCDASAQDNGEYAFWMDQDTAIDDAVNDDWYVVNTMGKPIVLLCPKHAPGCACKGCEACDDDGCGITLRDDEFGDHCEDCAEQKGSS